MTSGRSPSNGPWPDTYARSPRTRTSSNGSRTPGGAASGAGSWSPSSANRSSTAPIARVCHPASCRAARADIVAKPGQESLDGVVIDSESIPGTSTTYAGPLRPGRDRHARGRHWLDLEHTFYGGCNAQGDFLSGTPPQRTPTSESTSGQTQRMRDAWLLYRAVGDTASPVSRRLRWRTGDAGT